MAKNKCTTFFLLILFTLSLWGCHSSSNIPWGYASQSNTSGGVSGADTILSIVGPVKLDVVNNKWSSNPFTVIASLQNNTDSTIIGSSLTLDLSAASGLGLDTGEVATHDLSDILPGETEQTSWSILAVAPGFWTYSVQDETGLTTESSITVPILCGDLDHDGDVDEDDYTIFESALGTCSGDSEFNEEADYDGDGKITYDDYVKWNDCYEAYNQ
ncbi:MAG: hypothetical protein J7L53_12195 [Deltaproteobacteria bacterium]|nr:hypothetical protein [Deltaproteobacteria bacterium]